MYNYIFQYHIVSYTVGLDLLFIALGPMIICIGKYDLPRMIKY